MQDIRRGGLRIKILSFVLLMFFVGLTFVISSCSRGNSSGGDKPVKARETFPSQKLSKAKNLIQEGFDSYRNAMKEDDQFERDRILDKVLEEYFYPAQNILDDIKEKFDDSEQISAVDSTYEDLSRKINDVVRSKGMTSHE